MSPHFRKHHNSLAIVPTLCLIANGLSSRPEGSTNWVNVWNTALFGEIVDNLGGGRKGCVKGVAFTGGLIWAEKYVRIVADYAVEKHTMVGLSGAKTFDALVRQVTSLDVSGEEPLQDDAIDGTTAISTSHRLTPVVPFNVVDPKDQRFMNESVCFINDLSSIFRREWPNYPMRDISSVSNALTDFTHMSMSNARHVSGWLAKQALYDHLRSIPEAKFNEAYRLYDNAECADPLRLLCEEPQLSLQNFAYSTNAGDWNNDNTVWNKYFPDIVYRPDLLAVKGPMLAQMKRLGALPRDQRKKNNVRTKYEGLTYFYIFVNLQLHCM